MLNIRTTFFFLRGLDNHHNTNTTQHPTSTTVEFVGGEDKQQQETSLPLLSLPSLIRSWLPYLGLYWDDYVSPAGGW